MNIWMQHAGIPLLPIIYLPCFFPQLISSGQLSLLPSTGWKKLSWLDHTV